MNKRFLKNGFTLVELIVVIAIIGILVAVLNASFQQARESAKNKAIQAALKETQLAIELYKSQNGVYPPGETTFCSTGPTTAGVGRVSDKACASTDFIKDTPTTFNFVPEYIAELPDYNISANAACDIVYAVATDGSYYKLTAKRCMAGAANASKGVQPNDEFARCPNSCSQCEGTAFNSSYKSSSAFYESWAVYSLGGQCL